jgi:hypothetical protein
VTVTPPIWKLDTKLVALTAMAAEVTSESLGTVYAVSPYSSLHSPIEQSLTAGAPGNGAYLYRRSQAARGRCNLSSGV